MPKGVSRRLASSVSTVSAVVALLSSSFSLKGCRGFTPMTLNNANTARRQTRPLCVFAPPGSGYVRSSDLTDDDADDDDDVAFSRSDIAQISPPAFPSTYEPMLEYPGTMRPGRTPENMPYHDLPNLGIDDPDPVPWPHFQEIEWHHRWDPPHPQALAMEEFIEVQGRWASVEEEAEMRMGMRRGVRERRETEELAAKGGGSGTGGVQPMVIMDDEEEEDGGGGNDRSTIGIGLGEGVEALLTSAADNAVRVDARDEDETVEDESEDTSDNFLFDLGLGGEDEETEESEAAVISNKRYDTPKNSASMEASEASEEEEDDDKMEDDLDLDFELGFDLDDDDERDENDEENADFDDDYDDDEDEISLDEYTKEDDGGDDDEFDDGGFDYGD